MLGAGFSVLVVGLVVFFTVRTLRQNAGDERTTVTTPEDAARVVGGIGPPQGTPVATYIENRRQELSEATGDRVAVVSLNEYTTEDNAKAVVGGVEVLALLAAPPGGSPTVVTGDMAAWADAQTADARAERDEIQKLIPTVTEDPQFQKFYREEVDRLNALIRTIRPSGNMVFGVVVRAPALALQQLAAKPEVRLVDVGPGAAPPAKAEYRGLRPEETSRTNDPNTRPA
jgi:hypothetical protein